MFNSHSFSLYGGHQDEVNCLVFTRDLEILLTASIDGYIRLWNTVFEHLTLKINEKAGRIRALAISNNDRYFASTASDTDVRLYETRTGCLLYRLKGHTHVSDCLQFSPDSQLIASGAWDCRTVLWNVITGEAIYSFQNHTSAVQSISFHPKRNLMSTGSHDHTVLLYNFDQPAPLKPVVLRGHFGNVRALAFSHIPYLASAGWDKIIVIWHIELARIRARLFGHSGWIHAVTFLEDEEGTTLASTDDETVRVWNILTGECLHRLSIISDISCFLRFLPDQTGLLVGGAVYELLADQWVLPRDRPRTKRIREPITGEEVMMAKQPTTVHRQRRNNKNIKLPTLQTRPSTQQAPRRRKTHIS